MSIRIIDIPVESTFIDKQNYNKLTKDEIIDSKIFLGDVKYKTDTFKDTYKQALFNILIKYYKKYFDNNSTFNIPDSIDKRTKQYMSDSDEIYNFINDILIKTDNNKDCIKVKDLFNDFKISQTYVNMTKEEKRNYTYSKFCSKLESNIFLGKYLTTNKDKIKILIKHAFINTDYYTNNDNNIDKNIIAI